MASVLINHSGRSVIVADNFFGQCVRQRICTFLFCVNSVFFRSCIDTHCQNARCHPTLPALFHCPVYFLHVCCLFFHYFFQRQADFRCDITLLSESSLFFSPCFCSTFSMLFTHACNRGIHVHTRTWIKHWTTMVSIAKITTSMQKMWQNANIPPLPVDTYFLFTVYWIETAPGKKLHIEIIWCTWIFSEKRNRSRAVDSGQWSLFVFCFCFFCSTDDIGRRCALKAPRVDESWSR